MSAAHDTLGFALVADRLIHLVEVVNLVLLFVFLEVSVAVFQKKVALDGHCFVSKVARRRHFEVTGERLLLVQRLAALRRYVALL